MFFTSLELREGAIGKENKKPVTERWMGYVWSSGRRERAREEDWEVTRVQEENVNNPVWAWKSREENAAEEKPIEKEKQNHRGDEIHI